MKKYIFLAFMLCGLQSFAGVPASYNKRLNALTDMPLIGLQNFSGLGVLDESAKLQALYNKFNNVDASSLRDSGFTIFWPEGINWVKVNNQVYGEGYVKMEGAHFFYDDGATMGESTPMILFIGKSKVYFKYCQFTGTHTKLIGAFVQLNSSPNQCDKVKVDHCYFGDAAVQNALNFGGAGADSDWNYWIDHIYITYSSFKHIWTQGYQANPDDLFGGLFKYNNRGINLQQTSLRVKILHCEAEDISSDWVFGAGSTTGMQQHKQMGKYYGNWEIAFNTATKCGMMVELNGNRYGQGVNIHHNYFTNSTRNGGFLISSCMSIKQQICNNILSNVSRGLIEANGKYVTISTNTGTIESWTDTSQGVQPTPLPAGSNRIHFIEADGYKYKIINNDFEAKKTSTASYDPAEYDGIMVRGGTSSPGYQDTSFDDVSGNCAGYWDISGNTLTGCNARPLDVSIRPVYHLSFTNNVVSSSTMTGSPYMIWGSYWIFTNNETTLNNCYPTNGNAAIVLNPEQKTSPNSIVGNNIFWNSAWKTKWFISGASATNIFK